VAAAGRRPESVPVATRLGLHRARADLRFALADYEGSREEAETLATLARSAGDRVAEAGALEQTANATMWEQDFPQALEHARHALHLDQVGTDSVNHRCSAPRCAASLIRRFISRTASRMPMNTARLTIAWPM